MVFILISDTILLHLKGEIHAFDSAENLVAFLVESQASVAKVFIETDTKSIEYSLNDLNWLEKRSFVNNLRNERTHKIRNTSKQSHTLKVTEFLLSEDELSVLDSLTQLPNVQKKPLPQLHSVSALVEKKYQQSSCFTFIELVNGINFITIMKDGESEQKFIPSQLLTKDILYPLFDNKRFEKGSVILLILRLEQTRLTDNFVQILKEWQGSDFNHAQLEQMTVMDFVKNNLCKPSKFWRKHSHDSIESLDYLGWNTILEFQKKIKYARNILSISVIGFLFLAISWQQNQIIKENITTLKSTVNNMNQNLEHIDQTKLLQQKHQLISAWKGDDKDELQLLSQLGDVLGQYPQIILNSFLWERNAEDSSSSQLSHYTVSISIEVNDVNHESESFSFIKTLKQIMKSFGGVFQQIQCQSGACEHALDENYFQMNSQESGKQKIEFTGIWNPK